MGLGSSSDAIRKCVSSYCTCVTWARAEPTPAKVVQNKNTHLQTASEHPPRPKPVRLLGPTARAPSTSRPRPPRPATSLTVIYDSARRSPCAPPAPAKPRSAAARPRHLPRPAWWPPPAARRRSATPCRPPGDLRRPQDQEALARWFTAGASFAARLFCPRAAYQLGRSARHRQRAGRSSVSRPRASTRSTCEGGQSEGSGDRAFLGGRLLSPFGSSGADELSRELPRRPRCNACGGRRT